MGALVENWSRENKVYLLAYYLKKCLHSETERHRTHGRLGLARRSLANWTLDDALEAHFNWLLVLSLQEMDQWAARCGTREAGCFQGDDNQSEYVITSVTLRVLHIKHVANSMQAKYGISLLKGFSLNVRPILYFSNDKANGIF